MNYPFMGFSLLLEKSDEMKIRGMPKFKLQIFRTGNRDNAEKNIYPKSKVRLHVE